MLKVHSTIIIFINLSSFLRIYIEEESILSIETNRKAGVQKCRVRLTY